MAVDQAADAAAAAPHAVTQTFAFEHLGAPWLVLPLVAAAVAIAVWSWRRYGPAPEGFAGLIARACRAAALALAVIILAGPALRRTVTTDLPYRAVVAIDRSASMARTDGANGTPRIAQATDLARQLEALKATNPLLAVDYRSIGGVAGAIPAQDLLEGAIAAPGASSPLADELDHLVVETRPDLLLLVSDGRVTAGSQLAAAAGRWRARDLQVMTLAAGTEAVEPELFLDEIVVNREAALNEIEPVAVRLSGRALPPGPVTVTLEIEGEPTVTQTIDPGQIAPDDAAKLRPLEARLEATFHHEGTAKLKVSASSAGTKHPLATAPQELSVQVRERKLAVLILAHRPFYELRYLREAFKRDKTMTVHAYLAEGRWRRWGTEGPETLPLGSAELAAYDAIIIGDLGRDALRDADLEHLESAVRRGGAGLVWMVGETGAVATFATSRIGDLLPATLPDAQAIARGFAEGTPRRLKRTEIASGLGLLDPSSSEGGLDWPQLPSLLGAAPIAKASVKPGAEVLAEDQDGDPLVITKAYPAGRALLIGVDDTWRWRRNVGDRYLHRFYSQLLRFAASGRRGGDRAWRLFAAPRRAVPGETVALNLMPLPQLGQPETGTDSVSVSLTGPGGAQQLVRLDREANGYTARLTAPAPGSWTLEVAGGIDPRRVDPGELKVLAPEDELRDPRLDRPGLQAFAKTTGGAVFGDAKALIAALPKDLRKSESVTVDVGLWDNWWMLGLMVGLFAVEWSLRRANRLP
jgi:hypothetical protein